MGKLIAYLLIPLFLISFLVQAQNCSQQLEEANRAYYQGNLRNVKTLLAGCLNSGLPKSEKTEALRLLANTQLLLNQNSEADQYVRQLLEEDPTYRLRKNDLEELKYLFNTYEVITKYSIGPMVGIMRPDYRIVKHQSAAGNTVEPEDYNESFGYHMGLAGDIALYQNFFLSSALLYDYRSFSQEEIILGLQTVKSTEREYRLSIPLQVKYIHQDWKYKPFISGGYSYHYLMKAEGDLEHFSLEPEFTGTAIGVPFSEDDYTLTPLRRRSTFNWLISAGVQKPVGDFLLEFRATYERGFNNLTEEESRFSDQTLLEDFAYVPDDVKVSAWTFGISLMRGFTKPIKK